MRALDGRYIEPAPGGDLLRMPEVLPTGRNLHGFDPFRMPSAFAVKDAKQAKPTNCWRVTPRRWPRLCPKASPWCCGAQRQFEIEGAPIGQALALMGALPRFDSYGRLAGASPDPLERTGPPPH